MMATIIVVCTLTKEKHDKEQRRGKSDCPFAPIEKRSASLESLAFGYPHHNDNACSCYCISHRDVRIFTPRH